MKNSPTAWGCYQHTLLLGWYSAGNEQSWLTSNMMLRIEVNQTGEYYFSESEGPLGAFSKCVFMCLNWREDEFGHTAIKPRSMECCSGVCPSVGFSYLHIWSSSSTRVTISFLVTTLTKALLHQFGQEASSRNSPCCFKLLPLRVTEITCFCDPSMKQNFFLNSSPDVWLDSNGFWSIQAVNLTSGLGFCSDMHFQLLDLLLRCVCLSKSYPFNLNLPQVTTWNVVTYTSNMMLRS